MFDYLLSRPFKEMQDIIHRLEENTDHRSKWEVMLDDWGLRAAPPPKEESLAETATVDDEESEDEEEDQKDESESDEEEKPPEGEDAL